MTEPERPLVYVHLLPALIPPGALRGGAAVVVDVLRATTVMAHALDAGCEAIFPCGEIDEALRTRSTLPPGTALLAGERGGLPIEGFDLGNSPGDFTPEVCRGKTLVMTTTNGTRALLASLDAEAVLVAAFVNLDATLDALAAPRPRPSTPWRRPVGRPVHVVCAGTDGFVSAEDSLMAGAVVAGLVDRGAEPGNDEAVMAAAYWRDSGSSLADALKQGRGGRRVLELGLGRDLEDAARLDRFRLVAALERDPTRVVRVS